MKKTLSAILILMLLTCIGFSFAYAAGPVIPDSPTTPTGGSSSTAAESNGNTGGSIVIIDPESGKPVETPAPAPTIYVVDTIPVITKNPGSESVEAGDDVVFVAHANYAETVTWYLTDGNAFIPAAEVGNHFKGVTATGTNTDRLVLSKVSDKMDGWSAVARFDNAMGATWTNEAKLSVAPDPNASPSPTPTPTPAPSPTPTPVPANVPSNTGGTATQHGTGNTSGGNTVGNSDNTAIGNTDGADSIPATGLPTTGTATTASAGSARNSHVGAYILATVAGLVIIASVLIMALYMKGKISLGRFEKFLGSFGNDNDAEMFDESSEFYNPDDFKEEKDDKK